MARRKRIPYDPPGNRKKRRRRGPIPGADQIFLSRRMFVAKGAVVTAFTALAGKLGFMQVAQHADYRQQAQNNVLWPVLLKAPRGLIYDRASRMLADNRRSWEVRVIPDKLPEKPAERDAVVDRISAELGLPDALVIDPAEVPIGSEQTVYAGVIRAMQAAGVVGVRGPETTPEEWLTFIAREANPNRNYLLLLENDLSVDQAAQLRAALPGLPGVKVMNRLRYAIGNTGDPRSEVIAKSDVPREVALKLEANKLYLPGLVLDNEVLVRRYHGGETMSHVLGFARKVDEEALNAPENQDEFGKPIYKLDDIIGVDGLEYTFEEHLRGKKGLVTVEVDTHGVEQRKLIDTQKDPLPGKNLKLTIDLELQAAITKALADGITFSNEDRKAKADQGKAKPLKHPAQEGSVVAIDPRSGEVLALVSYPLYDNQLFVDGISTRKYQEYTAKDRGEPLLNKAIAGEYPPGSTLKTFLAASALNDKKISRTTTFTCTGEIKVPYDWDESKGTFHRCWLAEGHSTVDVYGALEQSCDVFFYNVGAPEDKLEGAPQALRYYDYNPNTGLSGEKHFFKGLGIEQIQKDLTRQFWFGNPTGLDLPGERPGVVPTPAWLARTNPEENWSLSATLNVSIGQGYFLATPLQVALNTAAVANGGTVHKPLLIKEIVDAGGKAVETFAPKVLRQLELKPQHIEAVREGMRRVVHGEKGTARQAINVETGQMVTKWPLTNPEGEDQIEIGGKTGTAEFGEVDPEDGRYTRAHAWFTAFAPFDKPEIAIAVIIDDGGEGSSYAVPVADKAFRAYFELSGKRERGLVLSKDGNPAAGGSTGESSAAGTPAPGSIVSPNADEGTAGDR